MLLSHVVSWLDHNHAVYWTAAGCATAWLAAWTIQGAWSEPAKPGDRPERGLTGALVFAALLAAWRWPFWFDPAGLNPDEGQLVAGAQTLAFDPVFWRAVDGGTAGPLNFYLLLWVKLLALPVGFLTARITGLLLIWGTLFFSYRLLRLFLASGPARLAMVPAALFFAMATQGDFTHYSTEHLPLFLLAAAAFSLARSSQTGGGGAAWWCGGLGLGLLPWAKLQSIPLGAAVLAWVAWMLWHTATLTRREKTRRFGQLLLAGLAPTLLGLTLIGLAGVWPVFVHNYVLQNFHYVADGFTAASLWTITIESLNQTWHFQACLAGAFLLTVAGSIGGFFFRRAPRGSLEAFGFGLFAAAALAVMAPRRPYPHYLLFLVLPLTYWFAAVIGLFWDRATSRPQRLRLAFSCLVLTAGWPLVLRFSQPAPEMLDRLAATRASPRTAAGEILLAVTQPGDRLAVWGWMSDFYVETGLRQATRHSNSFLCINPNPQSDYHRAEYLAALRRHRPAVFVDAVGRTADFFQARSLQAHDACFPELAAFIRENYVEFVDVEYARIYVRPDRLAAAALDATRMRALIAAGHPVRGKSATRVGSIGADTLPQKTIDGRNVSMMLPRAEISWLLDGTEREFRFECGYDPRAYLEGSSNGTLFTAELTTPGGATYPVYSRLLDPGHRPADRGLVADRFTLPPVLKGSRLTLRTSPGPEENDVWDWAYLASAAFDCSPLYASPQFPGFNRVPDAVTDDVAYLENEAGQPVLVLHAPAQLVFRLHGGETAVSFDFGLRAGTYENGGNTDGAGCTVVLRHPGGNEEPVFRRVLKPVGEPLDRGRQNTLLILPAGITAGTELVITLDAGPDGGSAWDWTYLANLQVR